MDCNCSKTKKNTNKSKQPQSTPPNKRLPFYAEYPSQNTKTECEGACDLVKRIDNYNNNIIKFYAKNQKGINELPQRTKQMMYLTKNYTQGSS